jgi:hypothetical protein
MFYHHLYNKHVGIKGLIADLLDAYKKEVKSLSIRAVQAYLESTITNPNILIVVDFAIAPTKEIIDEVRTTVHSIFEGMYKVRLSFIGFGNTESDTFGNVTKILLSESESGIGKKFVRKTLRVVNENRIDEIVQFTGNSFEYLDIVESVWPEKRHENQEDVDINIYKHSNHLGARILVQQQISSSVGVFLQGLYPDVVAVARFVLKFGSISVESANRIANEVYEDPENFTQRPSFVDVLEKENLFFVDDGKITFQNTATRNFAMNLLSNSTTEGK